MEEGSVTDIASPGLRRTVDWSTRAGLAALGALWFVVWHAAPGPGFHAPPPNSWSLEGLTRAVSECDYGLAAALSALALPLALVLQRVVASAPGTRRTAWWWFLALLSAIPLWFAMLVALWSWGYVD